MNVAKVFRPCFQIGLFSPMPALFRSDYVSQYKNQLCKSILHCLTKKWIYLTPYICIEWIFDSRPFMCNKTFFEKTLIEVGSSHLYASFGTFCVQIGQFFEAQWVFEKCLKTVKSLFSKENEVDFEFFRKFKVSKNLPIWTQKVPKEA